MWPRGTAVVEVPLIFGVHSLGHGSSRQTLMVSGLLSRHSPMVLSRVWHRAFLCCVPFPHVTEHCKQARRCVCYRANSKMLKGETQSRGRPAYLRPGSHPPLGGAGLAVAGSAGLWPVVVAVFVVDGARGVVLRWLHAADGPDLQSRLSAGFAAVLPVSCNPAVGQRNRDRLDEAKEPSQPVRIAPAKKWSQCAHGRRAGLLVAVSDIPSRFHVGFVTEALVDHLAVHFPPAAISQILLPCSHRGWSVGGL